MFHLKNPTEKWEVDQIKEYFKGALKLISSVTDVTKIQLELGTGNRNHLGNPGL